MTEMNSPIDTSSETNALPVQNTIKEFLKAADVSAVYAEPVIHGDTMIIPSAEVLSGLGFGMGYGGGESPETEDGKVSSGSGGGGGGGGRVLSRPVAVIISDQHGVRVEPVVDPTKIAIALFTTLGFMAAMVGRMRGNKRRFKV